MNRLVVAYAHPKLHPDVASCGTVLRFLAIGVNDRAIARGGHDFGESRTTHDVLPDCLPLKGAVSAIVGGIFGGSGRGRVEHG